MNLAEVFIHTAEWSQKTGSDAVALFKASGVRLHIPDEAIARRVAKINTSLADGFAAATALELGARLHTTDTELIHQLRGKRIAITHYYNRASPRSTQWHGQNVCPHEPAPPLLRAIIRNAP